MEIAGDVFDLWTFVRTEDQPRYLLLETSQEKADRFFGGGRFWQIPGGFFDEPTDVVRDLERACAEYGISPTRFYAVEHVYTIYNRRRERLELIPVFAAELAEEQAPTRTWEHARHMWATADEVRQRITFRGLLEGLEWTRLYVSEVTEPRAEFKLT